MTVTGPLRYTASVLAIALVYCGSAKLGLRLAMTSEQVSVVWPATGIALACLFLLGARMWPAIALGAFAANVITNEPVLTAAGIAAGNTLEAVIGAALLRRARFRPQLTRAHDAAALVLLAGLVSTTVSATIGVTSLCLGRVEGWRRFFELWSTWWLGDAMGDLLVAPLLLSWLTSPLPRLHRTAEATGLVALTTVVLVVFAQRLAPGRSGDSLAYLLFPLELWAALRFGPRGSTSVAFASAVVAVVGTRGGNFGPFDGRSIHEGLVIVQSFLTMLSLSGLFLAATVTERSTIEMHRRTLHAATRVLSESDDAAEASRRLLPALCESLGWQTTAMWSVDEAAGVLRCAAFWTRPESPVPEFAEVTRARSFRPGEGLPGRVWQSAKPLWIPNIAADPNYPRGPMAARAGIPAAFAFPVQSGGRVDGVIEFFARRITEPDEDLLAFMAGLGGQIGQFLERRRAEREVHRLDRDLKRRFEELQTLLDTVPVGIAVARDRACTTITVNPAGAEILGVAPGTNVSLTGPSATSLPYRLLRDGRELGADDLPMQRSAMLGVAVRGANLEVARTGEASRHLLVQSSPLFDEQGEPRGCVAAFSDVSELHRLQQELRRRVDELAQADRMKDDFLAMLGHELRNPLAPILHAAELLRLRPSTDPDVAKSREIIERQVRHLTRLVDDLLDVARITRRKIQLDRVPTDLAKSISQAIESCRGLLDGRKHRLVLDLAEAPLIVTGDPVRLVQIVTNLLHNAAKFTPPEGLLRLVLLREGESAVLRVCDNGAGIAPDLLPRIFENFVQAPGTLDRSLGGLGLGLALVRMLVELHGGTVAARSEGKGLGSEFEVRLPLSVAREGTGADPVLVPLRQHGKTRLVLIVEDNADLTAMLKRIVESLGHEAHAEEDGASALAALERISPDVALIDIGLPGMDGRELVKELRRRHPDRGWRLVAMSGYGREEDKQLSLAAGFDAHLVKPLTHERLVELLGE